MEIIDLRTSEEKRALQLLKNPNPINRALGMSLLRNTIGWPPSAIIDQISGDWVVGATPQKWGTVLEECEQHKTAIHWNFSKMVMGRLFICSLRNDWNKKLGESEPSLFFGGLRLHTSTRERGRYGKRRRFKTVVMPKTISCDAFRKVFHEHWDALLAEYFDFNSGTFVDGFRNVSVVPIQPLVGFNYEKLTRIEHNGA